MSEPVTCLKCGAHILAATAQRTQGLCKPCAKKRKADEIGTTPFGREYDRVFHAPPLRTAHGRCCWTSVESFIAGPLYGTRQTGSAEYLFGERRPIPGVHNPQTLHAWLQEQAAQLQAAARHQLGNSEAERADRDALLSKASELVTLANEWLTFYLSAHPQWSG